MLELVAPRPAAGAIAAAAVGENERPGGSRVAVDDIATVWAALSAFMALVGRIVYFILASAHQ